MAAIIVSPQLLNLQAFPAQSSEPHLRPGNHLRIAHHPLLGLPQAPFLVSRARTDSMKGLAERTNAIWTDSRGNILTPPFQMSADNPVTARLIIPAGETCIWAEITASGRTATGAASDASAPTTADSTLVDATGVRAAPRVIPAGNVSSVSRPNLNLSAVLDTSIRGTALANIRENLRDVRDPRGSTSSPEKGLLIEAYVSMPSGLSCINRLTTMPYAFAASGLVEFRLFGNGFIRGINWMALSDTKRLGWEPWRLLNLPHKGGARYISVSNALGMSEMRVQEAAPGRTPLQEEADAMTPSGASPWTSSDDSQRVRSLSKPLDKDLNRLINDTSVPQAALTRTDALFDETGKNIGSVKLGLLPQILQATFDPGVAEWFGYMTLDEEHKDQNTNFVFYRIEGLWCYEPLKPTTPEAIAKKTLMDALIEAAFPKWQTKEGKEQAQDYAKTMQSFVTNDTGEIVFDAYEPKRPLLYAGAIAVADRRLAYPAPLPPRIDGTVHIDWMPSTPPSVKRDIRVDISAVVPNGLLAAAKSNPVTARPSPLNATNADKYHLPIVLGRSVSDDRPLAAGQGFITDRMGNENPTRFMVAQQDGFGRWSDRAIADNLPPARPGPPIPVFQAFYKQPKLSPSLPGLAPAGTLLVQVAVPKPEKLAPASFPVVDFVLDVSMGATGSQTVVVSNPNNPAADLSFNVSASLVPALNPTEQRKLRLVAKWRDTNGAMSEFSEPLIVTLTDPRAPAQLNVPNTLIYTARPDVQGRALVEHTWTASPGQSIFAVYYTDENRLRSELETQANSSTTVRAILDQIEAASNPADRAALFRANASRFKEHLFERLEGVVQDLGGGQFRFAHYVSGSLKILNFYRISAESSNNARVDVHSLPIITYGIPNSEPPAVPMLAISPQLPADNTGTYSAQVKVKLKPGMTQASVFRLRRSTLGASNITQMPIVSTGAMGVVGDDGFQIGTLSDVGALVISPTTLLKPWAQYTWVAEVQGAPEPGSSPPKPGRWSAPSDPVTLAFVPPLAPATVINLTAHGTNTLSGFENVRLRFNHAEDLSGGSFGSYRVQIYRIRPGETAMKLLSEVNVSGMGPFEVSGIPAVGGPVDHSPASTIWRLIVLDPIGRASAAVDVTTVTPI
jgi:hypothetical protein